MADIIGTAGNDDLLGTEAADRVRAGDGNDVVTLLGGNDEASGEGGDDRLFGGDGGDMLSGGAGADELDGGAGDDTLSGGSGANILRGGAGDDLYVGVGAGDQVFEAVGGGRDVLIVEGSFTLAAGQEVEVLVLANGPNDLGGNEFANELFGNDFGNRLSGGAGDDLIYGREGDDLLTGGAGDDLLDGGEGVDRAVIASALADSAIAFEASGEIVVTGADGRDTLIGVQSIQFTDGLLDLRASLVVNDIYREWGGRGATTGELRFWTSEIAAGRADAGGVRAAILSDPLGRDHVTATVTAIYETHGGRAPTPGEVEVWRGLIGGGADFDAVRAAILGDPLGRTAAAVTELYAEYGGRAATDDELGVWQGLIRNGATLDTVRGAILGDPLGQDHLTATVTALYRDYGGRDPSGGELGVWRGLIEDGAGYGAVRAAILDDGLGREYVAGRIDELYRDVFDRAPSAGELATWQGLVRGGATLDTLLATLLTDGGSDATGTQRLRGTAEADAFELDDMPRDAVIDAFDFRADTLLVYGEAIDRAELLDGAREVRELDGSTDVLLSLFDGRSVLLKDVDLSDLGAGDFVLI